jgi:hypothetical protein
MFTNNPLHVEKLAYTKQEEILRELPNRHVYELPPEEGFSVRRVKFKRWIPVGLLVALAWLVSVLTGARSMPEDHYG